jgi:hypothetical protein
MRYMLLLKGDAEAGAPRDEKAEFAMRTYIDDLARAGVLLAAEGLQPSSTGVRIRFAGSERTLVEGPFKESNPVAGYLVIQVKSKEEAIEWASRCPVDRSLEGGEAMEVEVRQVASGTNAG